MKNVLLKISYDGTDFAGWQRQDSGEVKNTQRTVQGEIETALEKLLKKPVNLFGSGRTDSGVHALGQKANFFSPFDSIPEKNYVKAINAFLPGDVRILDSSFVPDDFNARFNATSRLYRYFINTGVASNAAMNRFSWNVNYKPDLERLNAYCSYLKGETDCSSFAASGDESVSMNRYIEGARFFTQPVFPDGKEYLVFEIEANAFLWKMVRTLTGTFIEMDRDGKSPEQFEKILNAHDRRKAGVTAPGKGLFLYEIKFDGIRRHV